MKVIDIALKDLVRSFRSVFAIGMMVVAPLLITGLIYFAFGGLSAGAGKVDLPPTKVAIVNLDQPTVATVDLGAGLVAYLHDSAMPSWMQVVEMPDEATARQALDRQQVGMIVVIPENLSEAAFDASARANIRLVQDPTSTIGPALVRDLLGLYLDGVSGGRIALDVARSELAAAGRPLNAADQPVLIQSYSAWYTKLERDLHHSAEPLLITQSPGASAGAPERADSTAALMARVMGGMLVFFVFFTAANTAESILREDEEGTLARLFATPTPRAVILAGKFASVVVTITVQSAVLLAASALAFHVEWGAPPAVGACVFGLVALAAGFGILVVSFLKSTRQSGPVLGGVLTVTSMLGGVFTVGTALPAAFDTASLAMPQGLAMRAVKLVLDGADGGAVLPTVLLMVVLGFVFFAIGALRFRRRFD